jgi:hypothetical protein
MTDNEANQYWFYFRINEPNCKRVLFGGYASHDEAMKEREKAKYWHTSHREYVSTVFVAKSKEEAEKRAEFF